MHDAACVQRRGRRAAPDRRAGGFPSAPPSVASLPPDQRLRPSAPSAPTSDPSPRRRDAQAHPSSPSAALSHTAHRHTTKKRWRKHVWPKLCLGLARRSRGPGQAQGMRFITTLTVATVAALALLAPTASAATRSYEGTVVSVDRGAHTFKLRDSERGTVRVKVVSATRFERISGFSALRAGQRRIEVTVRRSGDRWVAVTVERSGGGGHHGNND